MPKVVFSALYNETLEYLELFLNNFLAHTSEDSELVVNISDKVSLPTSYHVPPRITIITARAQRSAFGSTLLTGHMEVFHHAEVALPDFEWFVPVASNSLFIRKFDIDAAILRAASQGMLSKNTDFDAQIDALPNHWHWPKLQGFEPAAARLNERWGIRGFFKGQIEGQFSSRENWSKVARVHEDLAGMWVGLEAPLEEILPYTVINSIGTGQKAHICHVHWSRSEGKFVKMADLIDLSDMFQHVCMMKWFQRSHLSAETLSVSTDFGRGLLAVARAELCSVSRAQFLVLLQSYILAMERVADAQSVNLTPLSVKKWKISADRQIIELNGDMFTPELPIRPYIYFENTGDFLEITASIRSEDKIRIGCDFIDISKQSDAGMSLQGYLYIPLSNLASLNQSNECLIRLSGYIEHGAANIIQGRCVLFNGIYTILEPISAHTVMVESAREEFHLQFAGKTAGHQSYFGVPIYTGTIFDVRLDYIYA